MFSCDEIWRAIERLAKMHKMSMSRLAILAGLDSTAFNLSKRFKSDGSARWPSTATLAKILTVTGTSLGQFAALVEAQSTRRPAEPRRDRARGTILLVEDDETLGAVSAEILRGAGYRVHFAQSHPAALELLASGEPIDLLYTDIVMPAGLGGIALARIAQLRRPGIKIIYSTAYDIPGLDGTGSDIVLHKPVDTARLLSAVGRVIQESKEGASLH